MKWCKEEMEKVRRRRGQHPRQGAEGLSPPAREAPGAGGFPCLRMLLQNRMHRKPL